MIRILDIKNNKDLSKVLDKIGVYPEGVKIMTDKGIIYPMLVDKIDNRAAAILKENFLSVGADVAVHSDVVRFRRGKNAVLILSTRKELFMANEKLKLQPYGLLQLSKEIDVFLKNIDEKYILKFKNKKKILDTKTLLMGIINVTPDSFFDGGKYFSDDKVLARAKEMLTAKVDIIDIGGESTRPNADFVSKSDELKRVVRAVEIIRKKYPKSIISIDTYKSEVAEAALKKGADIINDIYGLRFDKKMAKIIAKYNAGIVIMHMQGTPKTMQQNPKYKDVVADIIDFFAKQIDYAISNGIDRSSIILDPGIGFGKTLEHNLLILKNIKEFRSLGFPVLVGASRKTFLGKITGLEVDDRLYASLAVSSYLSEKNVDIIRVHDVEYTRQILDVIEAIKHV